MSKGIWLDAPNLGELEKEYLCKALESNFVSTAGPFVPEFETKFAQYLKVDSCVSVQSGTAAIHAAFYELGIGAGDEVIVPAVTFVATVNPILYVGATPVFVDIDINSWNINPDEIEKAITPRTKAIVPVHLYGNPCNMERIVQIAKRHDLYIIEDATESLGAVYQGVMTGTIGDIGCFSFNGNKIITTGGGGMIAAKDGERAKHIKFLVNQARDAERGYYHPELGFNYRMTNLEAALGLAQFERLNDFLAKKQRYLEIYQEKFADIPVIHMQKIEPDSSTSSWLASVRIDVAGLDLTIPEIQTKLKENGIPTRRIFVPVPDFPYFKKYHAGNFPQSYRLYNEGLNLPSSTLNSEGDVEFVADAFVKIITD